MSNKVEQFYSSMADAYHLIFEDWDRAIARQAGILNIRGEARVVERAFGIGVSALAEAIATFGERLNVQPA
ncbi:MAG: hypothetical protein ACRYFU_24685 [Janthinobacterium lividum]